MKSNDKRMVIVMSLILFGWFVIQRLFSSNTQVWVDSLVVYNSAILILTSLWKKFRGNNKTLVTIALLVINIALVLY